MHLYHKYHHEKLPFSPPQDYTWSCSYFKIQSFVARAASEQTMQRNTQDYASVHIKPIICQCSL